MNKKIVQFQMIMTVMIVFVAVGLTWIPSISDMATTYVDAGLKRSLVSFASARALNGVISVLQGTQFVAEPFGFGIVLSLGEILDPINDMVEAFSSVMLTASVAFGIQKLLLMVGSNWVVSAFVTGIAALWSVLFWWGKAPSWLSRLLIVMLFIRFVMPVTMLGSAFLFEQFSAQEYEQSQAALKSTAESLQGLRKDVEVVPKIEPQNVLPPPVAPVAPVAPANGFFGPVKDKFAEAVANVHGVAVNVGKAVVAGVQISADTMRGKFEATKAKAEQAVEKMIRLIVIFLMQTLVIPLILMWVLYQLTAGLLGARPLPQKQVG